MGDKRIFSLVLVLLFILSSNLSSGAKISGSIYDYNLQKINDIIVRINTQPEQMLVAKNGSYEFNAPIGNYTLTAILKQDNITISSAQENISISQEGDYRRDIILFPNIDLDTSDKNISIEDINNLFNEQEKGTDTGILILLGAILLVFILVTIFILRRKVKTEVQPSEKVEKSGKKEIEKDYSEQILEFIKKEKHTTQKAIRKEFPFSEAKISLVLSDLEDRKVIRKIKKGRGNIIVYQSTQ